LPEQPGAIASGTKNSSEQGSPIEKIKKEKTGVTPANADSFNKAGDAKKETAKKEIRKQKQSPGVQYATKNKKQHKKTSNENANNLAINQNPEEQRAQVKSEQTGTIVKANPGQDKVPSAGLIVSKLNPASNKLIAATELPDKTMKTNTESAYITQVAMIDNSVDDIDTDNTSAKKSKLRGIFRRVSRVFEKTTNADDGNKRSVAIGSFQIALK
jgi:hypothetical protein